MKTITEKNIIARINRALVVLGMSLTVNRKTTSTQWRYAVRLLENGSVLQHSGPSFILDLVGTAKNLGCLRDGESVALY